jgi:hypothetical protein
VTKKYQTTALDASALTVPERVSVAMAEIAADMREGLLALAVGAGLQASLDVADRPVAHPQKGALSLHFDTGLSTDAGSPTTEDSGVFSDRTHTGWLP